MEQTDPPLNKTAAFKYLESNSQPTHNTPQNQNIIAHEMGFASKSLYSWIRRVWYTLEDFYRVMRYPFGSDFFISYCRGEGLQYSRKLKELLLSKKHSSFLDESNMQSGQNWRAEVRKGIDSSKVVALVWTPDCADSLSVRYEIEHASRSRKHIVPIVFSGNKRSAHSTLVSSGLISEAILFVDEGSTSPCNGPSNATVENLCSSLIGVKFRTAKITIRIASLTITVLLIVIALILQNKKQQYASLSSAATSRYEQSQESPDPSTALLLALESTQQAPWSADKIRQHAYGALASAVDRAPKHLCTLPHESAVIRTSFSPDNREIVTVCENGTLRIWKIQSIEGNRFEPRVHPDTNFIDALYLPNGIEFATLARDQTLSIMTANSLRKVRSQPVDQPLRVHPGFSPTSINTVSRTGSITKWNVSDLERVESYVLGTPGLAYSSFNANGSIAALSESGTAFIFESKSKTTHSNSVARKALNQGPITIKDLTPSASLIVSSNSIQLLNASEVNSLNKLERARSLITSLAFFPGLGQTLVAVGFETGEIRILNPDSGEPDLVFGAHRSRVTYLDVKAGSAEMIASGTADGDLKIWRSSPYFSEAQFTLHGDTIECSDISTDGRTAVTGGFDDVAKVWSTESGRQSAMLIGHRDTIRSVEFSRSGDFILTASSDASLIVWNPQGAIQGTYPKPGMSPLDDSGLKATFNPLGTWVAAVSDNGSVFEVNVGTYELTNAFRPHDDGAIAVTYISSPERLVTAGRDGFVRIHEARSHKPLQALSIDSSGITILSSPTPHGFVAIGTGDGGISVWDLARGRLVRQLRNRGPAPISLSLDDRASMLASGARDGVARVWDISTGIELRAIPFHSRPVRDAVLSRDGRRLLTVSDRLAQIWLADLEDLKTAARERVQRYPAELTADERLRFGLGF